MIGFCSHLLCLLCVFPTLSPAAASTSESISKQPISQKITYIYLLNICAFPFYVLLITFFMISPPRSTIRSGYACLPVCQHVAVYAVGYHDYVSNCKKSSYIHMVDVMLVKRINLRHDMIESYIVEQEINTTTTTTKQ